MIQKILKEGRKAKRNTAVTQTRTSNKDIVNKASVPTSEVNAKDNIRAKTKPKAKASARKSDGTDRASTSLSDVKAKDNAPTAGTEVFVNALLVDSSVTDSVHHDSTGSNSSNDDANHAAVENSVSKIKSIEDNKEHAENSESISAKDKDMAVKSSDSGRSINDNADQICWYCHEDVTRVEINRCAGCKKVLKLNKNGHSHFTLSASTESHLRKKCRLGIAVKRKKMRKILGKNCRLVIAARSARKRIGAGTEIIVC